MKKKQSNLIAFPDKEPAQKDRKERVRHLDRIKYFNEKQIKLLRRTVRDQAEISIRKGQVTGVREWVIIDLMTSTGLRVSEAANLRCGDLKIGYTESKVLVERGRERSPGMLSSTNRSKRT